MLTARKVRCRVLDDLLTTGGATVVISRSAGTGAVSATADNGNGTYTATVTSPTATGSGTFVATLGGKPAGCDAFKKLDDATCEVKRMFVDPEFRKRGVARALMRLEEAGVRVFQAQHANVRETVAAAAAGTLPAMTTQMACAGHGHHG